MKSKTLLIICLLLCVLLAGCGQSAAKSTPPAATPTATPAPALADPDIAECVQSATYKGLSTEKQEDTALTDAEFDYALYVLLSQHATTEQITDRSVEEGDTINLDYIARSGDTLVTDFWKDGAEITVGDGTTFAAFEDALVGHSCLEDFSVSVVLPEDLSEQYGGQTVDVMVRINYIESDPVLPELTDEFVASLDGWNCTTVDEFKDAFRDYLSQQKSDYYENQYKEALWDQVLLGAVITDAGNDYIAAYTNQQMDGYRSDAESNGMTLDALAQYYGYDDGEALSASVEKQAKTLLVMKYIADAEGIAYTDDEYYDAVDAYAEQMGFDSTADMISTYGVDAIKDTVGNGLLYQKVIDFVAANAA